MDAIYIIKTENKFEENTLKKIESRLFLNIFVNGIDYWRYDINMF